MLSAKEEKGFIKLRFISHLELDAFKSYINRIKSIPGRKFDGSSAWTIPSSEKETLNRLFSKAELMWETSPKVDQPVSFNKTIPTDFSFLDELKLQPYPFQVVGINFLCHIGCGILADEMGLGKTNQIIGSIYKLYRGGGIKRTLIICPSTLKYQWEQEIEKFVDTNKYNIDYIVVDGTPKKRQEVYEEVKNGNILYTIINYELVVKDIKYLKEIEWDVIALKLH